MSKKDPADKSILQLIGIAFELTAMVIFGAFIGKYIGGEYFDSQPIGTLVGVLLGFSLWLFRILKTLALVDQSRVEGTSDSKPSDDK